MNARAAPVALQGVVAGFGGAFPLLAFRAALGMTLGILVVKRPVAGFPFGASPVGHIAALVTENPEHVVVRRADSATPFGSDVLEGRIAPSLTFKSVTPTPVGAPLPVFVGQLDIVSEFYVVATRVGFENIKRFSLVRQPDCAPRFVDARNPVVFGFQGVPRSERCPDFLDTRPVEKIVPSRHDIVVPETLRMDVAQRDHEEQGHE